MGVVVCPVHSHRSSHAVSSRRQERSNAAKERCMYEYITMHKGTSFVSLPYVSLSPISLGLFDSLIPSHLSSTLPSKHLPLLV